MVRVLKSLSCLVVAVLAGCGTASGPEPQIEVVVPVSGTVTYRGTPLEYYQVTFDPGDGRRAAVGITDAQGHFTLGTNDEADGAPPGRHKVGIAFAGPPTGESTAMETPIDDPTQLPQPKVKIPEHYGDPERSGLTRDVPENGATDLKIELE